MNGSAPRVRVFTRGWCVYCLAAKRLMRRLDVPIEELRVDHDPELWKRASAAAGGWPTVPMIFIDDRFIGGYREVRSMHRRGVLRALLTGAGAS